MQPLSPIRSIRAGSYLGECLVRCNETIQITPGCVSYSLTGNVPDPSNPDISGEAPARPEDWEQLCRAVDWDRLRRLPAVFGRPDHSDVGGEFIEISGGESRRRFDLDLGASIPELEPLLGLLRELRRQAAERHAQ